MWGWTLHRLERKIDTLTLGVDSIDARLDALELEKLPQRVGALEAQLGNRIVVGCP
jgi:hypothetical protein